ncbi:MAG TPA: hypothetical protein DDY98_00555 [Ruminococcaceae bacterium]|nr:hypothetical protein [Oscillospiraceae bacterium]
MKSICVMNEKNNEVVWENLAQKILSVLGKRIVLMTDDRAQTKYYAEKLRDGIVKGCGTVFFQEGGFETELLFVSQCLESDCSIYLFFDAACRMSLYGANGKPLDEEEQRLIMQAAPDRCTASKRKGQVIEFSRRNAYRLKAKEIGESFENVAVSFSSPNENLLRFVRQTALSLGAVHRTKPSFCVSASGLNAVARDENGKVYTKEMLLNLCYACEIEQKKELTVPFTASFLLTELARQNGVVLKRSFDGGDEPWQNDAILLVFRVLHHMSRLGQSLSTLFGRYTQPTERKTVLPFHGSPDLLADTVACEECVTDTNRFLYVKRKNASAVLSFSESTKRCCVEVQGCNAEIAQALSEDIEQALNLTFFEK